MKFYLEDRPSEIFLKPPFKMVPVVVWFFFILCYIFYPDSQILRGNLFDTDDYTYLAQTIDWLKGQNWFDNMQYRYAPPEGTMIHFTRFNELPLAALILIFKSVGLPWVGAGTVAAIIWPAIVFALFLFVVRWAADAVMSKDWSRLTSYVALTAALFSWFVLGHPDHHALVITLGIAAIGFSARLFKEPDVFKWAIGAGFCLALSLAIALEALPWVVLIAGYAGLWAVVKGRVAARSAALLGVSLHAFSLLFLIVLRSPENWFSLDLMFYSMVYVLLTGGMALCLVGVFLASTMERSVFRVLVGVSLSMSVATAFFVFFPDLLKGPYGAMNEELANFFFSNISEAIPMIAADRSALAIIPRLFPCVFAAFVSGYFMMDEREENRWAWGEFVLLLAVSIALSSFYQVRFINCAAAFSIIPLTVFLWKGWAWCAAHYTGRGRFWLEIYLILWVGPLFSVIIPALGDQRSFNPGMTMFPVHQRDAKCDMRTLEIALTLPGYYGSKPLTIMNVIDQGPELVFRTRHKVMAAPYHMNVKGNLDAYRFFSTRDPAVAEKIAKDDNIDLVILCEDVPKAYFGKFDGSSITVDGDGKGNGEIKLRDDASFIEQLMNHKVPAWLKEVDIPLLTNYKVFEMQGHFPPKEFDFNEMLKKPQNP